MLLKESEMLVSLEHAGIFRSSRWLVRGVSMSVSAGEIVTLIGPNGSGKSTTAKLTLGLLKPDEGKAFRKPNLHVGYVPQKESVDWDFPVTALDVVTMGLYKKIGWCLPVRNKHRTQA
ncbi:MAG: ATP-binding cassette domain-containing protein, partial [Candidatus Puniceispirillales bacterium]